LALRTSLLAATLLAALVWILRLLARRLMRFLAGLTGPVALSVPLTILVGIALFGISLMVGNIRQLSISVVRSGKFKRKPFNSNIEAHFVIIAALAFSYPRVSSDRDRSISNPTTNRSIEAMPSARL
jgi:uncharacterized membrane protein